MGKKSQVITELESKLAQVQEAYDKILSHQAKYGTNQGERTTNAENYWYGDNAFNHLDGNEYFSESGFAIKDVSRSELMYVGFVTTWKQFVRTVFGEEWKGVEKGFIDRAEERLFTNGSVAAFKHPITGNLVAENFSYNESELNVETNKPIKIKIVSQNEALNGLELEGDNFVAIFNNSTRTAELATDLPRLEMITNSYMSLALTIRKGKPKTIITGMDDDSIANDIIRAIESDNWIEYLNISTKQLQQMDIRFDNSFKDRMEMVISSISDFIKFKGFNSNGLIMKRERQSEKELNNNDEFKHYLVYNKVVERKEAAEEIKTKLGFDISYDAEELMQIIKGEPCTEEESENIEKTE